MSEAKTVTPRRPSLGDVVIVAMPSGGNPDRSARAIVTRIDRDDSGVDLKFDLDGQQNREIHGVPHDPSGAGNTWRWPEEVK